MKLKRIIGMLILISILLVAFCNVFTTKTYAANPSYTLGILGLRKSGGGYVIDVSENGDPAYRPIWKIVSYPDTGSTSANYDNAFYCIKAEVGFGESYPSEEKKEYIMYNGQRNNMKIKKADGNGYDVLDRLNLINNAHPGNSQLSLESYNKILWIFDNMYLPGKSSEQDKQALIQKASEACDADIDTILLSDDDIEVVQQMALWYYTNSDQIGYHQNSSEGVPVLRTLLWNKNSGIDWIKEGSNATIENNKNYKGFEDWFHEENPLAETNFGRVRQEQAEILYEYLVGNANGSYNDSPVSLVNPDGITAFQDGERFKIGPFKLTGNLNRTYNELVFKDQNGNQINLTGENQLIANNSVVASGRLQDVIGNTFYISLPINTPITNVTFSLKYPTTTATYYEAGGTDFVNQQPVVLVEKSTAEITKPIPMPNARYLDLALRKSITKINGTAPSVNRLPDVDETPLQNGGTTANYNHPKNDLVTTTGQEIEYTINVYNEGGKDGYASEIKDYLPAGIEFVELVSPKDKYTAQAVKNDNGTTTVTITNTGKTVLQKYTTGDPKNEAFTIKCKITAEAGTTNKRLVNIAEITKYFDAESNMEKLEDRDSQTVGNGLFPNDKKNNQYIGNGTEGNYTKGQQDDDDFEPIVIPAKYFDLALRKFITHINGTLVTPSREPVVDVSKLISGESTTATYTHPKNPVGVRVGDIVTYAIRVYNEGQLDGYASEVTDHLPEWLEFLPEDETNVANGWYYDETDTRLRTIKTNHLSKDVDAENVIKAFDGKTTLSYKEVVVKCKVKDTQADKITNIADITKFTDKDGNPVTDRDSQENNVVLPEDKDLPNYKDDETNKPYVPGQQDDDDFEKLQIQMFDLALRKFITKVNNLDINNRYPQLSMGENGNIKYTHTKEPVEVENGNIITYTIRVYNEGRMDGYAKEVTDDLPQGLEYLPQNELNKQYRWVMIDKDGKKTDDVTKAKKITTDYLSKEQEKEEGVNLIKAFDKEAGIKEKNPDYRDVKIAFKVTEPNTSDRILINTAEISDDSDSDGKPVDDIDSIPGNNKPGEDDIDIEKVKVKYFDLALKKWVTQAIVIENGKQTVTESGHTGDENPEPVVKVDLKSKNYKKVTVKFKYKIKVINEGQIEGYAKEVKDYIPDGLKFVKEDNPDWTALNDKEIVTSKLQNTLLKPGESATVDVILTWQNSEDNLGLKVNVAEISKDYNESHTPDIDSTPNNKKEGEDDIDDAPVILSIKTGNDPVYVVLSGVSLLILAGGVYLIKKYVL